MTEPYAVSHAMAIERVVTSILGGSPPATAPVSDDVPADAVPYVRAAAVIISAIYSGMAPSMGRRPADLWRAQCAAVAQHRLNRNAP